MPQNVEVDQAAFACWQALLFDSGQVGGLTGYKGAEGIMIELYVFYLELLSRNGSSYIILERTFTVDGVLRKAHVDNRVYESRTFHSRR